MDLDALIRRAKKGDREALDTLYRTYCARMVSLCMNTIGADRATASDLVHDAFILAFASIGSLRDGSRFGEWLATIVRNVALRHVERRDRLHILPLSAIQKDETLFIDTVHSPESDINHKELLQLIARLPEGYRTILRLSAVEGFSHQEIADMLGIKPHSSSSQLARAKVVLRRMLGGRAIGIIALLLLPLSMFLLYRQGEEQQREVATVSEERGAVSEEREYRASPNKIKKLKNQKIKNTITANNTRRKLFSLLAPRSPLLEKSIPAPRTSKKDDSRSSLLETVPDVLIAEAAEDSTKWMPKDSVAIPVAPPEFNLAEEHGTRGRKWQLLAAGSVGPALAQSAYRLLAVDNGREPDKDIPSDVKSDHVKTWEEYSSHLASIPSSDATAETNALKDIADHNTGDIVQREHHEKPITFGIALTKQLGGPWSMESGLQYSILRSQFSMGADGYSIDSRQQIHYLGLPLRLSYSWARYKQLSAYGSVGVTMHLPVVGREHSSYTVNWQTAYSENRHFTPSLQWQTGAALGLQYRFAPSASLFVEPTVSWFIPSGGDTHTIWTERPIMFTCPFGLRFTW